MAVANENAVKYAELTDQHIVDIKRGVEVFVKENEYWDKFCHHASVKRGHKEFSYRKLVKPIVKEEDVSERAEFVAPRPTKIVYQTFKKSVTNYGDKAIYSKEDLQYNFDDTVKNIRDVLGEIAVQKKDFIKGKPFFNSACIITYDTNLLTTLKKASIILRKNGAKRWDGKHWLAHITPEVKNQLIAELEAKGVSLSEKVKIELNGRAYDFDAYGDWIFSDTIVPQMYKSDTVQRMVFMGKRGTDGQSPVEVSKLEGESDIELINNPLGSGVLVDVDGNYTSDDNKQQGSVAINMDGLGATVSDDLCILDCEITINEVKGSALAIAEQTGYVSHSGAEIEIGLTGTTYTELSVEGARYDSTAGKYYGSASTIVAVKVAAAAGKTLGTVTAANWTATYKNTSAGDNINAEILGVVKGDANNDTLIVRVPVNAYSFSVACAATAS